jgi:hypothetical protein
MHIPMHIPTQLRQPPKADSDGANRSYADSDNEYPDLPLDESRTASRVKTNAQL